MTPTVRHLRFELQGRGLKLSGRKAELLERLAEDDRRIAELLREAKERRAAKRRPLIMEAGIEAVTVADLQDLIRELAPERDELREQLTAQTNAIRSLRAVVLSMAAREGSPRADFLAIADSLSRIMANDFPSPKEDAMQPMEAGTCGRANPHHPDREATSTASRSGSSSHFGDPDDSPQPRDLPPTILPAHPGLHPSPAPSPVEAAHSSSAVDGATSHQTPPKGKE